MRVCRGIKIRPPGPLGRALERFDRDDSGAIVLLGLVAILILMLLSWVLYDSGQMSRNKLDTQTAADTAAYSQAAIKARSMNNLAYANIAKRTTVGIHSQYKALWKAYKMWFAKQVALCAAGDDHACDLVTENEPILEAEQSHDFKNYRDQLGEKYYLQDIIAIDNFQRYTHALTPWWGWSEAVLRAGRNGATMTASFPAPRGKAVGAPILNDITDRVISEVGWTPLVRYSGHYDQLPVRVSTYRDMLGYGMSSPLSFESEYQANNDQHKQNSEGGAATQEVIQAARSYFGGAVTNYSKSVFGEHGKPWRLFETTNPARWTTWTSNLVITYRREEEMFDQMRQKYAVPDKDYALEKEDRYRSTGYFGMARGEISFHGSDAPDLWHPSWTARLRPVALPGEFDHAGFKMSAVWHDILPYMALSGIINTGDDGVVRDSMDDLVFMERANRALGPSTVEGVAK